MNKDTVTRITPDEATGLWTHLCCLPNQGNCRKGEARHITIEHCEVPRMKLEEIWPPYALTISAGNMRLTPVRESDYEELAEIARGGVRKDDIQAFMVDWDSGPDKQIARNIATYQWSTRANFSVSEWTIEFCVRVDDRTVGVQGTNAKSYPKTRTISTGSWLARNEQGQGYGTQMRAMVISAFSQHFSAMAFETAYVEGNEASRNVSRKLGYPPNGSHVIITQDGEARRENRMSLHAADYRHDGPDVHVAGAKTFRKFIGLGST